MAHLTNFSFEFVYKIFTEDASQRLLYHGAKKSKMTKNSNQGGPALNKCKYNKIQYNTRRRASVRGDHRAQRARDQERASGKSPSRWACCFSWSWSRWFRRYQSSEKLTLCWGNTWKLTAAQRSFRDWCSGGQETRSAWLPSGPLPWRAAAENSKNWMSKQSPEERTPRSLSHERWSTDDTDILFHGGNTRTLASHSPAVLFQ